MEPVGGVLGVQGSGEVFGTMVEATRTVLRGDGFAWRAGCHDRRRIGCRVLFSVRHDAVFPPVATDQANANKNTATSGLPTLLRSDYRLVFRGTDDMLEDNQVV